MIQRVVLEDLVSLLLDVDCLSFFFDTFVLDFLSLELLDFLSLLLSGLVVVGNSSTSDSISNSTAVGRSVNVLGRIATGARVGTDGERSDVGADDGLVLVGADEGLNVVGANDDRDAVESTGEAVGTIKMSVGYTNS